MRWHKQNRLVNREKSEVDESKREEGISFVKGKGSFSSDIVVLSEGTENTEEVDSWEVSYPSLFFTSSYVPSRETDVLHVPENCAC